MLHLHLLTILAKDGGPGILFFILGESTSINNVDLFNLCLGLL